MVIEYKDLKKDPEEKINHFIKDISKNVKNIERKIIEGKKLLNHTSDISLKLSHLITEVRDLYWVLGSRNGNGYYKKSKDYSDNNGNGY